MTVPDAVASVDLGTLPPEQEALWHTAFDLAERMQGQWTLVGGQMVTLWCAQRSVAMPRVTIDIDALLDIRADSARFAQFDRTLRVEWGFESQVDPGGYQHRWRRGNVTVDVLVPTGSRSITEAKTALGGQGVQAPASNQALVRSEPVAVTVGTRTAVVPRPSLLGAIVMKSAALAIPKSTNAERHALDLTALLSGARAEDAIYDVTRSDQRYLRRAATILAQRPPRSLGDQDLSRVTQYLALATEP